MIVETLFEDEFDSFYIPILPMGRKLTFKILKTWGDVHYVGLVGIEVFNNEGMPINFKKSQISANPSDINILSDYGSDPRTIDKLIDGNYLTKDDLHSWLAPYTPGTPNLIELDIGSTTTISMIRIWNYNKNRIHSYRGVKDLII